MRRLLVEIYSVVAICKRCSGIAIRSFADKEVGGILPIGQ